MLGRFRSALTLRLSLSLALRRRSPDDRSEKQEQRCEQSQAGQLAAILHGTSKATSLELFVASITVAESLSARA
jgi:hypothetical protein